MRIMFSSLGKIGMRMKNIDNNNGYINGFEDGVYEKEDDWENVEEDVEWGIMKKDSEEGGTIEW